MNEVVGNPFLKLDLLHGRIRLGEIKSMNICSRDSHEFVLFKEPQVLKIELICEDIFVRTDQAMAFEQVLSDYKFSSILDRINGFRIFDVDESDVVGAHDLETGFFDSLNYGLSLV